LDADERRRLAGVHIRTIGSWLVGAEGLFVSANVHAAQQIRQVGRFDQLARWVRIA
jgi:hypothetical protein